MRQRGGQAHELPPPPNFTPKCHSPPSLSFQSLLLPSRGPAIASAGQGQRGEAGNERAIGLRISQLAAQRLQLGAWRETCAAGKKEGRGEEQELRKSDPTSPEVGDKTEAMIYVDTWLL